MDTSHSRNPSGELSGSALKLIAIAAMTVDHLAWFLFPGYPKQILPLAMHLIGRLTCPIMCFFIAEGYRRTRNLRNYALRLLLLAVVSHFAYVYASDAYTGWQSFLPFRGGSLLNQTSVVWSLLGGLAMLYICDRPDRSRIQKMLGVMLICLLTFAADWSCIAALCILSIGSNRGDARQQLRWCLLYVALYALVYCFAIDWVYGLLQFGVFLSVPLLRRYNGRRSRHPARNGLMKWLFYLYYPLHLAVLGLLRQLR